MQQYVIIVTPWNKEYLHVHIGRYDVSRILRKSELDIHKVKCTKIRLDVYVFMYAYMYVYL
jgi:hypothetical protein